MYIPVLQFKWSSTGSLAQLDRVVSCSRKWSVPWLVPICASASWCSWQLNYAPAQIGVPIFRKKVVTKGKSSHCAVLTGFQYFPGGSLQTRGPSLPHLRGWIRVDRGIVVSMQQTHIVLGVEWRYIPNARYGILICGILLTSPFFAHRWFAKIGIFQMTFFWCKIYQDPVGVFRIKM